MYIVPYCFKGEVKKSNTSLEPCSTPDEEDMYILVISIIIIGLEGSISPKMHIQLS